MSITARIISGLLVVLSAHPQARAERLVLASASYGKNIIAICDADGKAIWSHATAGPKTGHAGHHDIQLLDNGNLLFHDNWTTITEMTLDKKIVWTYDAGVMNGNKGKRLEVHAFRRLPNGLTMIAESGVGRIIEVDKDGKIQAEVKLKPGGTQHTRMARKLDNGNYLVCSENPGVVTEYNAKSEVVWEYPIKTRVYGAIRLKNGNTLIASGGGASVVEVTPNHKVVWEIKDTVPDTSITLKWTTFLTELGNGNFIVGNCHAGEKSPQIFEITRSKKVVWQFNRYDIFGNGLACSHVLSDRESALVRKRLVALGDVGSAQKLPKSLPDNIVEAWKQAGIEVGWASPDWDSFRWGSAMVFPKDPIPSNALPTFRVGRFKLGQLARLPQPQQPFGIDYGYAQLTDAGMKDLAAFKNLQLLSINGNKNITDAGLKELAPLTQLRFLNLESTQITDDVVKLLAPFKELQTLYLSRSALTDSAIKGLAALPKLKTLYLDDTKITDAGLKELGHLKALRAISIGGNKITDAGLADLGRLDQLEALSVTRLPITDAGVKEIAGLTTLRRLEIVATKVSNEGLKHVATLKKLHTLSMFNTPTTSDGLKALAGMKLLRLFIPNEAKNDEGLKHYLAAIDAVPRLDLSYWKVTDASFAELAKHKHLEEIDLNITLVTGAGASQLKALPKLRSLKMHTGKVTADGVKEIAELTQLQALDLGEAKITDADLKTLAPLSELKFLSLSQTRVTDKGMKDLAAFQRLETLYLSFLPISDKGLMELVALKSLKHIGGIGPTITPEGLKAFQKAAPKVTVGN